MITRKSKEETKFAGITVRESTTTYERNEIFGIGYGKERKVKEETNYLPMNDSTKKVVGAAIGYIGKKMLSNK
jgi:hypothetical protein